MKPKVPAPESQAQGQEGPALPFVVVGLSHKSAPVEVRERFETDGDAVPASLARLSQRPEIAEVVVLSTCNRVEIFALPAPPFGEDSTDRALDAVRQAISDQVGGKLPHELSQYLYERTGNDAVRHIFRVASSLDSLVVGEPQILGQVKEAHDSAKAAKTLGTLLGRCLSHAFMVAKRVRSETALGSGTVSVSSVAVDLARRIFGDLSEHAILLVGAGEMAEAAARSLGKGAKSIRVCNRSFERAAQLAAQFGGAAAPLEQLESELLISDVVVVSTGSRSYVVTKEMVKRVMKARKGRTLFFVDISVPRNVEPEVHGIDNVYVFNVDDLEDQVRQGLRARHAEVAQAEAIVEAEVGSFGAWVRALDVQPTIVALRGRTRGVLVAELERTLAGKLKHLPEADRAALLQMVDSATNKLLHGPTTQLKAGGEGQGELLRAVQTLFELPTRSDRAAADARADEAQDPEAPAERVTH